LEARRLLANYNVSQSFHFIFGYWYARFSFKHPLTLYRMVMPIGTPFLKEKINN